MRHSSQCKQHLSLLSVLFFLLLRPVALAQSKNFSNETVSELSYLARTDGGEWSWRARAALDVWEYLQGKNEPERPNRDQQIRKAQERIRAARMQEMEDAKKQWMQLKIDETDKDYRRGLEFVAERHLRKMSYLPLRKQLDQLGDFVKVFAGTKAAEAADERRKKLQARFPGKGAKPVQPNVKFDRISISPTEDELTALRIAHYNAALDDLELVGQMASAGIISFGQVVDGEQAVLKAKAKLPARLRESLAEILKRRIEVLTNWENELKQDLTRMPPPGPGAFPARFSDDFIRVRSEKRALELQLMRMREWDLPNENPDNPDSKAGKPMQNPPIKTPLPAPAK